MRRDLASLGQDRSQWHDSNAVIVLQLETSGWASGAASDLLLGPGGRLCNVFVLTLCYRSTFDVITNDRRLNESCPIGSIFLVGRSDVVCQFLWFVLHTCGAVCRYCCVSCSIWVPQYRLLARVARGTAAASGGMSRCMRCAVDLCTISREIKLT